MRKTESTVFSSFFSNFLVLFYTATGKVLQEKSIGFLYFADLNYKEN
jgi:hypothetical protein